MKILCKTLFDCSPTGVTGHYRTSSMPFKDKAGQPVTDQASWNFSRNQQRNWETINQLISLRTQPVDIAPAQCNNGVWHFEFEVDQPLVYSLSGQENDFDSLINECDNVPMITGLKETKTSNTVLITSGPDTNIWFEPINKALDGPYA
jgi:hypothetical protein